MNKFFEKGFKFIDLFAGIGGFHQAMKLCNGECVFAAEICPETANTYKDNYNIDALNDVSRIDPKKIPQHDVLCAGFPCQSFSKAGNQKGFNDIRGTLFFDIIRILNYHIQMYGGPKYLLLENVRNLISHDKGRTWKRIKESLIYIGYNVIDSPLIVSPHYFDVPQLRERALIVCVRNDIFNDKINISVNKKPKNTSDMNSILDSKNTKEYKLQSFKINEYEEKVLDLWDEFIKGIKEKVIGFPIWSEEFFTNTDLTYYPEWKKEIVLKNRKLYDNNREFIDSWYKKNGELKWVNKTHKKFEWQAGETISSVYQGIIQFRTSGVRVKQPTEFPALVAMVHIPIVGKYKRYLTPREVARLQSFPEDFKIDGNMRLAYKQFGNAVNVKVIKTVFTQFVDFVEENNEQHI